MWWRWWCFLMRDKREVVREMTGKTRRRGWRRRDEGARSARFLVSLGRLGEDSLSSSLLSTSLFSFSFGLNGALMNIDRAE